MRHAIRQVSLRRALLGLAAAALQEAVALFETCLRNRTEHGEDTGGTDLS
ncbi:hypothetical protein GCM10011345_20560 [Gemmobacter megaterium]|nr:hypothetical protein [Gemmobacter megaterium]GGE14513.1 hypothetical protein GCM10011345_20560 [Gemmobacter megaterium]